LPIARIVDEAHGGQVLAKKETDGAPNDRYWQILLQKYFSGEARKF
jgi:hypothetical protein